MALTREIILDACERYHRERDRYTKLTRFVEEACREEIGEQRSIRAHITSRTKYPASFEKKLFRFASDENKKAMSSVEDVFAEISDLSAVRISLYSQKDQTEVIAALKKRFVGKKADQLNTDERPGIEVDKKDKNLSQKTNFYRAVHCQVYLSDDDLKGENDNLGGLGCEIQICSMMAHVWNEIEHDIGYKPTGEVGQDEQSFLTSLGKLVREGDVLIDKLFAANMERLSSDFESKSEEDLEITNEYALQDALCKIFNIQRVTFESASLYNLLVLLGLTKYSDLKSVVSGSRPAWDTAKEEIKRFNTFLRRTGHENFQLKPNRSTDPALWIILQQRHEQILADFSAGRGQGRPRKIRSLASRYKEYLDVVG